MDSWTDNSYKVIRSDVENPQQFMSDFLGKWRLLKKHNFDEFLKSCGINIILRKAANALTPTEIIVEIEQGYYSLTYVSELNVYKVSRIFFFNIS